MTKPKILLQLDPDAHASVFDAVVAVDSGIDHLFQYSAVQPEQVRDLVHGAMFTRGPQDLHNTAIFIGGTNVSAGEELLHKVTHSFFGPMRVSVMLDANGANTTAAAAVLAAARHLELAGARVAVLAGTGPVGQRAARLAARQGAEVRIASRLRERAEQAAERIRLQVPESSVTGFAATCEAELTKLLEGVQVVIAAGAAGIELLPLAVRTKANALRVAVDLNAVPPAGIAGLEAFDKGVERDGLICYGAIGVGGTKMKIHRAAIARLFTTNHLVLDAEEIYEIGQQLGG